MQGLRTPLLCHHGLQFYNQVASTFSVHIVPYTLCMLYFGLSSEVFFCPFLSSHVLHYHTFPAEQILSLYDIWNPIFSLPANKRQTNVILILKEIMIIFNKRNSKDILHWVIVFDCILIPDNPGKTQVTIPQISSALPGYTLV